MAGQLACLKVKAIYHKWLFEGQGWLSDHACLINCLFHSDLKICCSNIKSITFWLTFYIFQN